MENRRSTLDAALQSVGLVYREDSELCKRYVEDAKGTPEDVALSMCRAHYLHNYCNFMLGRRIAHNTMRRRGNGRLPYRQWQALINRCVLATTDLKAFPERWPWLDGIGAEDWMGKHDLTPALLEEEETEEDNRTHYPSSSPEPSPAPGPAKHGEEGLV